MVEVTDSSTRRGTTLILLHQKPAPTQALLLLPRRRARAAIRDSGFATSLSAGDPAGYEDVSKVRNVKVRFEFALFNCSTGCSNWQQRMK